MLEEYARRIFGPDIKDDIKRRGDRSGGNIGVVPSAGESRKRRVSQAR
jgi:hypothetical protein